MQKSKPKRLVLRTETLRALDPVLLAAVRGAGELPDEDKLVSRYTRNCQ